MRVGVEFFGDIEELDGQTISTQFFVLGVPLIPLKSMFVIEEGISENRGFEMDIHGKSVLLGYIRTLAFVAGFTMILLGFLDLDLEFLRIPGILSAAAWIFTQFFVGRTSEQDKLKRRAIGATIGVNAYPHWLPTNVADSFMEAMENKYELLKADFENKDWKEYLKTNSVIPSINLGLLYSMACFNHHFEQNSESESLLEKAENLLTRTGV